MKKILPHIYVENCKEELEYYKQIFGGEIKNTQTGDGMEMFKGQEGKYIHAELHINENCVIYFADAFRPLIKGDNIWTMLDMSSEEEIKTIYEKLSKDGEIHMELQDTFWNARFAVVKDRNGFIWELNYSKQV
ncbi:VOC family protein [Bacillus sp. AFS055030]|uniref:VOC family protein n=1 Tax=Bacillus sp. AFS055030 TaxID=2033507 RepID=UPI000BFE2827|nr:VOC family protein [Bacillus sp. AFS055030]PGL71653.1 VOC family protein [Bacillus sp. AFS055030]